MSSSSNILTVFNDQFVEFLQDIQNVFPEDHDILTAKNSLIAIKKINPKLIIKIWCNNIVKKYKTEIENGNIDFFINKDYNNDLSFEEEQTNKITQAIDRLRKPIKEMSKENQTKTMKYIQNLTELSQMIS